MRKLDPFARLRQMAKDDRKTGEKCEEDEYSYEEKKLLLSCFYNAEQQTFLVCVVIHEILRLMKPDTGTPSSGQIFKNKSPSKNEKHKNHTAEHSSCSVCDIREELFKILWAVIIHRHCVDSGNLMEKADMLIDSMWLDMNTVITEVTESQGSKHDYFHDVKADAQEFLHANNFNFDLSDDSGLEFLRTKIINEVVWKITNSILPPDNADLKTMEHLYHMTGVFPDCVSVITDLTDNGVTCKYDKTLRTATIDFDVCMNCFLMANCNLECDNLKRWVKSLTLQICLKNGDSTDTPVPTDIPKNNKLKPNRSNVDGEIVNLPVEIASKNVLSSRATPGSVTSKTNGLSNRNPLTPHGDKEKNQMLLAINLKRKSECSKEQTRKSKRNRKTSSKFLNQFIYDDTDSENEIHELPNVDDKTEETLVKSPVAKKKISPKKSPLDKEITIKKENGSNQLVFQLPKLQPTDGSLNINLGSTKFLTNSVNKIMKQSISSDRINPIKLPSLRKVIIRPKKNKTVEFIKLLPGTSNSSLQPVKLTPMTSNAKMLILAPVSNAKIKPKPITVSTTPIQQRFIQPNLVASSVKTLSTHVKPTPIVFQNAKQIGSTVSMTKLKNQIHLLPISFPSSTHSKLTLSKVQYTGTKLLTSTSNESILQLGKTQPKYQTITTAPFKNVLGNIIVTKSPFLKQGIVKLKPITSPMVVPLPKSSTTPQSSKYNTTTVQILSDPSEQKLRPADKSPHKRKKIQPDKSMGEVIQEFVQSIIYDEEEAQKTASSKKWSSNEIPVPYEANFLCIGDTIETSGWKAYWYRRCRCAKVKEYEATDSEEKYVPTPAELRLWVKGETGDEPKIEQRFSDVDDDESPEENTEKSEKVSLKSKLVRDKSGNWVLSHSPSNINTKHEKPETSMEKRAKFEKEVETFLDKNKNISDDAMKQLRLAMSSEFEKYLAETKRPMGPTNTTFIFHQHRDLTFYNSKLNIIRPTTNCFKDFSIFKNVALRKLRHIQSNHQKLLTKKTPKVKLNHRSSKAGDLGFSLLKSQDIEPQKRRRISQDQPSIKPTQTERGSLNIPQISTQSKPYHFHHNRKITSNKTKLIAPTIKPRTKGSISKHKNLTLSKRSVHLESVINFDRNIMSNRTKLNAPTVNQKTKAVIPKYGHPTTSKHSMHLESNFNFVPYVEKISDVNVPVNFESQVMSMLEESWGDFSLPVKERRRTITKTLNMFTMDNNYVKECIKPLNKWLKTEDEVKDSILLNEKVETMKLEDLENLAEKLEHDLLNVTIEHKPSTKKTEKIVETIDLTVDKVSNKRSLCNFGTIVAVATGVVVNKPKQSENTKTDLSNRRKNNHCDKKKKLNVTDENMNNISSDIVGELVYADIPSLQSFTTTSIVSPEENYEAGNSYEVTPLISPTEPNKQSYICQSETYIKGFHYHIPPAEAQNLHGLTTNILDISENSQETAALQVNEDGDEDDWEYDTDSESSGISSDEDEAGNSSNHPIIISDSSNDEEEIEEITSSEEGENKSYKRHMDDKCDTTTPQPLAEQDSAILEFRAKLLLTPCDDGASKSISNENTATRRSLRKRKQSLVKDEGENTKTPKQKQHPVNEEHDMQITRKRGRPKLQALRKRVYAKIQNQELSPPSTNVHNEDLLNSEQLNRRSRRTTLQKLTPSSFNKRGGNTRKIKEKFSTNGSFISQLISSDE